MDGIRRHAFSCRADIIICDSCGTKESIEDAVEADLLKGNIEEWSIPKGVYHIFAEEDESGWKVSIPETGVEGHCDSPSDIVPTGVKLKAGEQTISNPSTVTYEIYQLKPGIHNHGIAFMSLCYLQEKGIEVERERYEMVYQGVMADEPTEHLIDSIDLLDRLYLKFNTDQPIDFKGHSLSVSNVVVIYKDRTTKAYYVDIFGFTEVLEFLKE